MIKLSKIVCLIFLLLFITHYPCKSTELDNVSTIISFFPNERLLVDTTSTTPVQAIKLLVESSTNKSTVRENDSVFTQSVAISSTSKNEHNVSAVISPSFPNELLPIETTFTIPMEARVFVVESSTNKYSLGENDYASTYNDKIPSTSENEQLDNVSAVMSPYFAKELLPMETTLIIPIDARALVAESSTESILGENDYALTENVTISSTSEDDRKTSQNISKVHKRKSKKRKVKKERIINGQRAVKGQFPYQAGILIKKNYYDYFFTCGGSILNESFVLTAAHCYSGNYDYYIIAGEVDRLAPGIKMHKVEKFLVRKQYSRITLISDIAIIKIEDTFWDGSRPYWDGSDTTTLIAPIQIIDYAIQDRTKAIVSGWGKTRDTGEASRFLFWIELTMMSKFWCMIKNIHWLSGMICLESVNKAVCQGDSGGPAVVGHKLAGIVSWGKGACANMKNPGVFTDVYHYRQWILYNQSCKNQPSLSTLIVTSILGMALYFYYV